MRFLPTRLRQYDKNQSDRFESAEITDRFVRAVSKEDDTIIRNVFGYATDEADRILEEKLKKYRKIVPDYRTTLRSGEYVFSPELFEIIRSILNPELHRDARGYAVTFRVPLSEATLRVIDIALRAQGVHAYRVTAILEHLKHAQSVFNAGMDKECGPTCRLEDVVPEFISHERAHREFWQLLKDDRRTPIRAFSKVVQNPHASSRWGSVIDPHSPFELMKQTLEKNRSTFTNDHMIIYSVGWEARTTPLFAEDLAVSLRRRGFQKAASIYEKLRQRSFVDRDLKWEEDQRLTISSKLPASDTEATFVAYCKEGSVSLEHQDEEENRRNYEFLTLVSSLLTNPSTLPSIKTAVLRHLVYATEGPLWIAIRREITQSFGVSTPELDAAWQEVVKIKGAQEAARIAAEAHQKFEQSKTSR